MHISCCTHQIAGSQLTPAVAGAVSDASASARGSRGTAPGGSASPASVASRGLLKLSSAAAVLEDDSHDSLQIACYLIPAQGQPWAR